REELAEQLGGLGRALHKVGETLRDEEQGQVARYGELLGDQAERVARFLREHDANDIVGEIENFARRQPLVFLGGCLLAGFAIGRFFKASPSEEERPSEEESMSLGAQARYEPPSVEPSGGGGEPIEASPSAPTGDVGVVETVTTPPAITETSTVPTPIVGPEREGEER
ncbi:MAG TPA: hypothetical protein VIL20_02075, partial [Sandaracinaceae bacterium]